MATRKERLDSALKLGARLVELRRKAGLTQAQVADRMARKGKGARSIACRLERGFYAHPKSETISAYLRACGAGPADVAGLLGMPSVPEPQPAGAQPKRAAKVLSREQKLARIERRAGRTFRQLMLEEMLYDLLKSPQLVEDLAAHKALAGFGRELFSLLERTYRARQRLRQKAGGSQEQVKLVERVVEETFRHMAESGDLERRPECDAGAVLAGRAKFRNVKRADDRVMEELRNEAAKWGRARGAVIERIRSECVRQLTAEGLTAKRIGPMSATVSEFCSVAMETAPGSAERAARGRAVAARARDEATRRRLEQLAQYAFRRWDELKSGIPPQPESLRPKKKH